jgi:hypothetical protein
MKCLSSSKCLQHDPHQPFRPVQIAPDKLSGSVCHCSDSAGRHSPLDPHEHNLIRFATYKKSAFYEGCSATSPAGSIKDKTYYINFIEHIRVGRTSAELRYRFFFQFVDEFKSMSF